MTNEPSQAQMEQAAEAQDEHFTALHGTDWASTSAQLRETRETLRQVTEKALKLRRWVDRANRERGLAERQRDDARAELRDTERRLLHRIDEVVQLTSERDSARSEANRLGVELRKAQLLGDLLTSTAGKWQHYEAGGRSWTVARAAGPDCALCRQQIRRGEGVEPVPASKGLFQHVHCPDKDPS